MDIKNLHKVLKNLCSPELCPWVKEVELSKYKIDAIDVYGMLLVPVWMQDDI